MARYIDPHDVKLKIKTLVEKFGLKRDDLAEALGIEKAVFAQVAAGLRETKHVLEVMQRAFGYDINRFWVLEEVVKSTPKEANEIFEAGRRAFSKLEPVQAHPTMVAAGHYQFVPGVEAGNAYALKQELREGDFGIAASVSLAQMVYRGGTLQHSYFKVSAHERECLVLDAHGGEELLIGMGGVMDLYIQRRVGGTFLRGTTEEDVDGKRRAIEAKGEARFARLIEAHPQTPETAEGAEDFAHWRKSSYAGDDGPYTDCEVITLRPGEVISFMSSVPHGLLLNPDFARSAQKNGLPIAATALVVAHGSFFGEYRYAKPMDSPPEEEAKKQ